MQANDATERNTIIASLWITKQEKETIMKWVGNALEI
jgi:hypothetical protein